MFGGLVGGMNALGSAWILVLMLLINADAFGRTLFNSPIIGVIEVIQISIVGIVFMQLADSLRTGVLTRSDGLFNQLNRRRPAAGRCLSVVTHLLGAAFMGLILYGSWPSMIEAWVEDHYIGVPGMFTAPMWPVKGIIVLASAVTMIQFLLIAAQPVRRDGGDSAEKY
jgi:TRAP-type C4-dicarboxylate transport system permease small subunit